MDVDSQKISEWHDETLPRQTKKALDFLSQQTWLKKSNWYLAGGTALALYTGNRKSVDLDFFTKKKNFDTKKLLAHFLENSRWHTTLEDTDTIYGELEKAKVSFTELSWYGNIRVLKPRDIAVMKLITISQRGRKRVFFDLYWCAHYLEPLEKLIKRLKVQYPSVAHNYHHILKSLVYFEDAETIRSQPFFLMQVGRKSRSFFLRKFRLL